jgi:hypothetical protein
MWSMTDADFIICVTICHRPMTIVVIIAIVLVNTIFSLDRLYLCNAPILVLLYCIVLYRILQRMSMRSAKAPHCRRTLRVAGEALKRSGVKGEIDLKRSILRTVRVGWQITRLALSPSLNLLLITAAALHVYNCAYFTAR